MAIALNVFKTKTAEITTVETSIYTAPAGKSAIILMAQIANLTNTSGTVTISHYYSDTSTTTELLKNFMIPGNDAASAVTGKLVLEEGHEIKVTASADNKFKITLSILESVNG
jgi:hypothetical protein